MSDSPRDADKAGRAHLWGRRDVLTALGWSAVGTSLLAASAAFGRLLFRRAPVEAPTLFRAGRPTDYAPGTVSDRFLKTWRVFIVHEGGRLYAIFGRCTHLGCTPRWYSRESKFKCPCHGSGFDTAGVNFEGPAPRPLQRARIWQDDAGDLWVDVGRRFERADWGQPGATLAVPTKERA